MGEKLRDLFRLYIGYLAVALVSVAYIATAFITVGTSEKSFWQILADGFLTFLLGILINRIFDMQGMMTGDRDERVLRTALLHNETVDRVAPYMDRLEDWCEERNREALRKVRKNILVRHGMRYDDYFDADGYAKDFVFKETYKNRKERRMDMRRFRCYQKAVFLKLTQLSAGMLISDGGRPDDPYFMGRTKPEYAKTTLKQDVVAKILTAALFGYFGVSLLQDFSIANLIWTVLQVGMFLVMGVIKMQQSTLFVTDEYRGRIIKKIDVLQLFEISTKEEKSDGNDGEKAERGQA